MVSGIFHYGSGVGNQLHRYVATRVLALDKGYDFAMVAPRNCKVKDFMSLDFGVLPPIDTYHTDMPSGKVMPLRLGLNEGPDGPSEWCPIWEEKTNYYNPEFNFIEDNIIIDGEFQDERYFGHRLGEVNEWLKVEPIDVPDDTCVIGFRGGEFALFPELFLTEEYWRIAISTMRQINPEMEFEVHTDDLRLADGYFAKLYPWLAVKIIHDVGINWRSMRYARYAIIANSSFYILPRLLKHHKDEESLTIAPRYWARRNTKEWSMPQNYYKCFTYL